MNYNIQALRALASLSVLFFHAIPFYELIGGNLGSAKMLFKSGYIGVDLFFVISGFIVAKIFNRNNAALVEVAKFFERRAYRIYFGYWPVLALVTAYYWKFLPQHFAQVDSVASIFLLSNKLPRLIIGQAWSLSFELFFYFLFALLALQRRVASQLLVAVYATVIIVLNIYNPLSQKSFYFNPHMLELFAGMLLGQANIASVWQQRIPLLAFAAATLLLTWVEWGSNSRLLTAVLVGGSAMLLVLISELLNQVGHNRASWLSELGDSSYALYLIHYLFLEIFVYHIAPVTSLKQALPVVFLLWLVAIVILAHVYYRWIERPIYRLACKVRPLSWPRKLMEW